MEKITTGAEFSNPFTSLEWKTEGVKPDGAKEAILYKDEKSGTYCRLLRLEPGFVGGKEPLCHEFDEIVYIISGGWVNERLGTRYEAGSFAVFPAGTKHGPLSAPVGVLALELRHYV